MILYFLGDYYGIINRLLSLVKNIPISLLLGQNPLDLLAILVADTIINGYDFVQLMVTKPLLRNQGEIK